jgi:hypothetical protein
MTLSARLTRDEPALRHAAKPCALGNGGPTSQTSVSLAKGRLGGADFTGGASQVSLAVPAGVPARLRLDGGALAATIGGHTYTGVAGGTVLAAPGWAQAANRYDIEAPAGVSAITVASATATASDRYPGGCSGACCPGACQ